MLKTNEETLGKVYLFLLVNSKESWKKMIAHPEAEKSQNRPNVLWLLRLYVGKSVILEINKTNYTGRDGFNTFHKISGVNVKFF